MAGSQLRGGRCRILDSHLRVRIAATGLTTYPDLSVVCGPRELSAEDPNAITNPTSIIEVTSKSSEDYDRGDKFEHYQQLASLQTYVVISHRERAIEVFSRDRAWKGQAFVAGDSLELSAIGARLDRGDRGSTSSHSRRSRRGSRREDAPRTWLRRRSSR